MRVQGNIIEVADLELPASFDELGVFQNDTVVHKPTENSEAVVVHSLRTSTVDTTLGNIVGLGHAVVDYLYMKFVGGGTVAQAFANETRYTVKDGTTVGTVYNLTHILEDDTETDGSVNTLILEHLPDKSSEATWVTNIETRYEDPRHILNTAGGILTTAEGIGLASYSAKKQDSYGIKTFVAGTPVSVTIPADLPEGFTCDYVQGDAYQVSFAVAYPGVLVNKNSHTKTGGLYSKANIQYLSPGYFLLSGETGT